MSNSPLLALPYLAASQAQKHVTVNEALSILDGLLHLSVITRVLATPPTTPPDGDRYLIAASPSGAWIGHAGQIALRMEGAWRFLTARTGWRIWVADETVLLVFNGNSWVAPPAPTEMQNLSLLGVNATADATNKLAVSSSAVLFNNVGAGVQFKINKAATADTASLLFQTGFSGRAEIGLSGDDDLHFKVSSAGSSFTESLIVSAASGVVTVKNTIALDPQSADPITPTNGQLWYNSTTGKFRGRQNGTSLDIVAAASALADGDKGDITVSASGATWTIDNSTITNAKLANVASGVFKARSSAGSGAVEDIGSTQATALLATATGSVKGLMAPADFTKIGGIASGATLNSADATLLARANHTGTQAATTITGLGSLATQSGTFSGTSSGTNTGDQNAFTTVAVSGQADVVADVSADTLTLVAGSNITITTNAAADTITINASGSGGSAMPYALKTAPYTVVAGDRGKTIDIGTNAVTLSLDAAATLGDGFYFFSKNSNSTAANYLTLDANGAETIDGVATLVDPPGIERMVFTDGTTWRTKIISGSNIDPVYTPAALAANTNDYDPLVKGASGTVRVSASAAVHITGLAGGAQGARRVLTNVGTFDILLKNENAASTAANRFTLPFGSFILGAAKSIEFAYDVASQRWRPTTMPDTRAVVYLASDVINNNATANTIADVTGLSFPVVSGQAYKFKFTISYDAAATTTGSRWTLNGPTATHLKYVSRYSLTATTETVNYASSYTVPAASNASSANTSMNAAVLEGTITPSTNGTLIARFASEVLSSAITAKAAVSFVEYEAIGN